MISRCFLAGMLLFLVACGGNAQLPPQQAAERAAQTMTATPAIHFAMTVTGGSGAPSLQSAQGDIVIPDRLRATIKARTLGLITEIGVVTIGDRQWATNPLSGRWEVVPPTSASFNLNTLFDPHLGIAGLLRTQSWTSKSAGSGGYLLHSTVDGSKLSALTAGFITTGNVDVQLHVDGGSFFVTELTLIEPAAKNDKPTNWHIVLTHPSDSVSIAAPLP
ncbi:MAG: LppX_LprAFG lipoprotein [Herpetosiphon sp.]